MPLLGGTGALGLARTSIGFLIEMMFLSDRPAADMESALRVLKSEMGNDIEVSVGLAEALTIHRVGVCRGECTRASSDEQKWRKLGAALMATCTAVKLGFLALEHTRGRVPRSTIAALVDAHDRRLLRYLRPWIRLYARHAERIASDALGTHLLPDLVDTDPEGWRLPGANVLPRLSGADRERLLSTIVNHANKEVVEALRAIRGPDIEEARFMLIQRQAPRILVRTFGAMTVHCGSWAGPEIEIDKRRLRGLLGLMAAHSGRVLSRDEALDILWPDADPASGVNSLNQAVFQLRRLFDPRYRDGESPQYILSTVEAVGLNDELVRTDLAEVRRLATRFDEAAAAGAERDLLTETVSLIRGEFLPDLKYDDWATEVQTGIHTELRAILLPIAERARSIISPDLAVLAALALIRLDEYDERAQVALAIALSDGGRRVAARESIRRFTRKIRDELDEEPSSLVNDALDAVARSSNRN